MKEEWRDNLEYGVEVSDLGRVRKDGIIVEPKEDKDGFSKISLKNRFYNRYEKKILDRLILETFDPISSSLLKEFKAEHLDGNYDNNELQNLEWRSRHSESI